MRYRLPPLTALHTFEAAARLASFTAAADELHVSTSTVSHRVRELEANLGVALFERLPRSVRLTDPGKAYLPVVRAAFDELFTATSGIFGASGAEQLTVRVPVSYGSCFLAPRLHGFTDDNPARIRIVSAIWGDEAPDTEVDLEVQFEDERAALGGAEVLGGERAVLVVSPPAVEGDGPRAADALRQCTPVHVMGHENLWQQLEAGSGRVVHNTTPRLTVDSWSAAIESVAAGANACALLPELLVSHALQTGQVVGIHGVSTPMRQTYRLLQPDQSAEATAQTNAFSGWLRNEHRTAPPTMA